MTDQTWPRIYDHKAVVFDLDPYEGYERDLTLAALPTAREMLAEAWEVGESELTIYLQASWVSQIPSVPQHLLTLRFLFQPSRLGAIPEEAIERSHQEIIAMAERSGVGIADHRQDAVS